MDVDKMQYISKKTKDMVKGPQTRFTRLQNLQMNRESGRSRALGPNPASSGRGNGDQKCR